MISVANSENSTMGYLKALSYRAYFSTRKMTWDMCSKARHFINSTKHFPMTWYRLWRSANSGDWTRIWQRPLLPPYQSGSEKRIGRDVWRSSADTWSFPGVPWSETWPITNLLQTCGQTTSRTCNQEQFDSETGRYNLGCVSVMFENRSNRIGLLMCRILLLTASTHLKSTSNWIRRCA